MTSLVVALVLMWSSAISASVLIADESYWPLPFCCIGALMALGIGLEER